uniref:Uncharacterized protein n=1 Tax=Tanacetum cinerariifolium TaxID=118510 RepID=A0A6L2JWL5_TANCI|nr:hypothetical protein [Tanacetum cinerariifolium]
MYNLGIITILFGGVYRSSHPLDRENKNLSSDAPASQPREILTSRNVKDGKSSRGASVYVPLWVIPQRCRVDTLERCQELMVHLAPPIAQEESNALTNKVALLRAWFSVARERMAQTDMLERFENLLADYDTLDEHTGCEQRVKIFKNEKNYLSAANHDQAAQIQALEVELAKKDFALTYAERMVSEGNKEREKLTTQQSQAGIERMDGAKG